MQKYKKYVEVLYIYSDTYEPTESQIIITRCPSLIKNTTFTPTISKVYTNINNQENILIIVLPTFFSVIVLFYILYRIYCLKYRININRKLDENFGTEYNNIIDF